LISPTTSTSKSEKILAGSDLRVTVFWGDRLYATTLCRPSQAVTVGHAFENTFVLDQNSNWKSVEIVRVFTDGSARLKFDESVTGHVKTDNKLVSFSTLRHSREMKKDDKGLFTVAFGRGEKADFVMGHVSFFFDWIESSEVLPRSLALEQTDKKKWLISVAILLFFTVGVFLCSYLIPARQDEKAPERLVTILPPHQVQQAKAAMGVKQSAEGGAQKGPPGKIATQVAPKTSAADQLRKANLGSLVSGLTSLGGKAPAVRSNVQREAPVNQVGTGGFTTDGLKYAGGGTTEGLGRTVGRGEGGFEGTGRLGLAGNATVEKGSGRDSGDKVIKGGLSNDVIESVIRRRQYRIRLCYERQLNFNPKLAGKITMHFAIGGKGNVVKASVSDDTMKNETVRNCVLDEVKSWTFPPPEGGTLVNVDYPFVFESSAHSSGA